jgi:hypothetical protein
MNLLWNSSPKPVESRGVFTSVNHIFVIAFPEVGIVYCTFPHGNWRCPKQVRDLLTKLSGLRERTQALLDLLAELRPGTIDRILEMDGEELGRRFLCGDLGRPFT